MPVNEQTKSFLEQLAANNVPRWDEMPPAESRELFSSLTDLFGPGPVLDRVENRTIEGVPVRVYAMHSEQPEPLMIYFHGGGWVLGDLDTHDSLCRHLALESGAVVIAVDYRRAPEHPYPAAFDDSFAVTRYVARHADEFGADAQRIGVIGDSAGGNLAAAVCLKARDYTEMSLRLQVLIYPVIEPTCETKSFEDFAEGFGLTRPTMKWFWQQYHADEPWADPFMAPGRALNLASLPEAHVITAEYDVLRDEGEAYAARLSKAGVDVSRCRYEGVIHGFVHLRAVFDDGRRAQSDIARVIRDRLSPA